PVNFLTFFQRLAYYCAVAVFKDFTFIGKHLADRFGGEARQGESSNGGGEQDFFHGMAPVVNEDLTIRLNANF
ncbi:hypothetical protein HMPREF9080_01158, partial [Cardiobacterium valvarum F0432]